MHRHMAMTEVDETYHKIRLFVSVTRMTILCAERGMHRTGGAIFPTRGGQSITVTESRLSRDGGRDCIYQPDHDEKWITARWMDRAAMKQHHAVGGKGSINEVAGNVNHVGVNPIIGVPRCQYRYRWYTEFAPFAPRLSANVRTGHPLPCPSVKNLTGPVGY